MLHYIIVVITVPTIIMFTVGLKFKLSVNIIVRPYVWTYGGLVVTSLHFIQIWKPINSASSKKKKKNDDAILNTCKITNK